MTAPHPHLGLLISGAALVLATLGAGVYAVLPIGDAEDEARDVVERYVESWAQARCDDAVDLIEGPRADVLADCNSDAARELEQLHIEATDITLDGEKGTAQLVVTFLDGGQEQTKTVHEELVRVDGAWKVAWRD